MKVGQRIKKRREELGLTQTELANKMNVTKSSISRVENGNDNLSTARLSRFADALETTESFLLGWTSEKKGEDANVTTSNNGFIHIERTTSSNVLDSVSRMLAYMSSFNYDELELLQGSLIDDKSRKKLLEYCEFLKQQRNNDKL